MNGALLGDADGSGNGGLVGPPEGAGNGKGDGSQLGKTGAKLEGIPGGFALGATVVGPAGIGFRGPTSKGAGEGSKDVGPTDGNSDATTGIMLG